jgi:hypothetical protein
MPSRLAQGKRKRTELSRLYGTMKQGMSFAILQAYPGRLVSLCMDGMRKVSPTRFEVIKTDYEPDRDLDVLFLALVPAEGGP